MSENAPGKTWRIGIAGLGTVGASLVELLAERPSFAPAGGEARISGVSARRRARSRSDAISAIPWFDDPVALAVSPTNDIFVELIGGEEGVGRSAVEAALEIGKPVVTANKALIAHHGARLAAIAEASGAPLLFEAAVMGGTPAVKLLREALVGDEIRLLAGILNGTSNFILGRMEAEGSSFADALAEAQELGYAEADPAMDISGVDAGHKITILAALAFNRAPLFSATDVRGLEAVDTLDIRLAAMLGYKIRLLAQASAAGETMSAGVHPALICRAHPLAGVEGAANALFIEGRRCGRIFLQGAGAGAGPTAAAVAADIADVMAGA
ncbi:MAG: homoserine dehydrogenase, partial [Caulobacteraceae bacterium]